MKTLSTMKARLLILSFTGAIALLAAGFLATEAPNPSVHYGDAKALGNGSARSFVTLGENDQPTAIGFTFDEAALTGLPEEIPPYNVLEVSLALPEGVEALPFNHLGLDWNPKGHEPEGIYTHPHFDFHFYTISEAERDQIMPTDPEFEAKAQRLPEATYIPAGYISPPGNFPIPRMGLHLLDPASPELHGGHMFTQTLIWGSYDGQINFIEPMVTKAYIESVKGLDGQAVTTPVTQPQAVAKAGYYPTHYSVRYDAKAKTYSVALEGLTYHEAAATSTE